MSLRRLLFWTSATGKPDFVLPAASTGMGYPADMKPGPFPTEIAPEYLETSGPRSERSGDDASTSPASCSTPDGAVQGSRISGSDKQRRAGESPQAASYSALREGVIEAAEFFLSSAEKFGDPEPYGMRTLLNRARLFPTQPSPESGSGEERASQDFGPREEDGGGLGSPDGAVQPEPPKGDSGRLAESTPTQPLQGSQVEQERDAVNWLRETWLPWLESRQPMEDTNTEFMVSDIRAAIQLIETQQTQLQRAEERCEDHKRAQRIALDERDKSVARSIALNRRVERAEACIQGAVKEFERRAANTGPNPSLASETYGAAAALLRSQASSEEPGRCGRSGQIVTSQGNRPYRGCVDCGQEKEAKTGAELIAAERERQVSEEGWTPGHDDEHDGGELEQAAACYLRPGNSFYTPGVPPPEWPFEAEAWKPTEREPARDLVKAGALIAAEIDRLQREDAR